ncbi:hypothetical protein ACMAZE_17445 [Pseudopelagicola sp. nBUS_20]|uniref:hypothetical protein n=1 Tax=Pseudopelagicola sp. nBUS_20 TaxID=3395317 RepID=UPI003EB80E10
MSGQIFFDPLVPLWVLILLAVLCAVGISFALWRGLSGWAFRALAGLVILLALAAPVLQVENRAALSDIVLLLVDQSASQRLSDRESQTEEAAKLLSTRISNRGNTELRRINVTDGIGDAGTEMMQALADGLAQEPRGRIAGVIALSDGLVHDMDRMPDVPAPVHLLHTGRAADWDRRLSVRNAPAFAILGEPVTLTLRIEDSGAAPVGAEEVSMDISVDGAEPDRYIVPIGRDIELPVTLPHGGRNVIQFAVAAEEGELTNRNNAALVQINGVRDRLRVLLVSGEPYSGGRTWRNLLKSDASVDLVHFTILRPPEKQDGVPVSELSLIAFPTRELFLEKIDDFDLIIFDRYQRRGILPSIYLENVASYVREGGAVLVAAGPDYATANSLYRSPISQILPASPTARVLDEEFRPVISELGARHPVTTGLPDQEVWGPWLRQVDVIPDAGTVLMTGYEDRPLLILNRVEKGRVALLASDHAWLWARGYQGGGPQMELLRRLAHWMMGEPELEEEALWAEATGQSVRIIRRSLNKNVGPVTITTPSKEIIELPLKEVEPGRFEATYDGADIGLYRLVNDNEKAVIGLGPAAPKEFISTIATSDDMVRLIDARRGGVFALEDGMPSVRNVREGRPAAGRDWIGLTPRKAFETLDIARTPLLPAWLVLFLTGALILVAWMREGRR